MTKADRQTPAHGLSLALLPPAFVDKVLLEHSRARSLRYRLWFLLHGLGLLQQRFFVRRDPKIFTLDLSRKCLQIWSLKSRTPEKAEVCSEGQS